MSVVDRLVHFPPFPTVPEPLRDRKMVLVEAAGLLSEDDTGALLRPLRELGPEMDTFATSPVGVLLELCGPEADSPLLGIEFRRLRGIAAAIDPDRLLVPNHQVRAY